MKKNGLLISVEGIDGSGKTVFSQALSKSLDQLNLQSVLTKEPGGTKFGLKLREILQYRHDFGQLDDRAEYLLFASDRAQHFSQVVIPNLQAGKIVISDRTSDSSIAYQGYGRGLDIDMIKQINNWAMAGIKPHLTIYLKIDLQTAQNRIEQRAEKLTAFEQAGVAFMQRVIGGFDKLYQDRLDVLILDGKLPIVDLINQSCGQILKLINNYI